MRTLKSVSILLVIALALLTLPTMGMAETPSTKTTLTFNQPIEIPGVVLAPGTYIFKTMGGDQHVVQVWDAKEAHVLATLLTRVNYLNKPAAKTVATLGERAGNAPRTLKSLQFKDENTSEEFLYTAASTLTPAISDAAGTEAERRAAKFFEEGCFLWTCNQ